MGISDPRLRRLSDSTGIAVACGLRENHDRFAFVSPIVKAETLELGNTSRWYWWNTSKYFPRDQAYISRVNQAAARHFRNGMVEYKASVPALAIEHWDSKICRGVLEALEKGRLKCCARIQGEEGMWDWDERREDESEDFFGAAEEARGDLGL